RMKNTERESVKNYSKKHQPSSSHPLPHHRQSRTSKTRRISNPAQADKTSNNNIRTKLSSSSRTNSSKQKIDNHRANPRAGRINKRKRSKINLRQRTRRSNQNNNRGSNPRHPLLQATKNKIRSNQVKVNGHLPRLSKTETKCRHRLRERAKAQPHQRHRRNRR